MRNILAPEELCQRLRLTVPTLQALTAGHSPEQWHYRPPANEWSATEIICHLRDVDLEVHLPRLRSLISEKEPFMPGVVADDWARERNYQAQNGPQALRALASARGKLLALLPAEDDNIWQRRGRHTFFGPTSFHELVCLVLEHDELHIDQISRTLEAVDRTEKE